MPKQSQMEVMRKARERAITEGTRFRTFNIKTSEERRRRDGSIIVAVQEVVREKDDRFYRAGFAFCSPAQPQPSRIFGEGLAALRMFNDRSAEIFKTEKGQRMVDVLRPLIIHHARLIKYVPWMAGKDIEDLV